MNNPKLLDIQILSALKKQSGNLSYIQKSLALADSGEGGPHALCWDDLTRKDVWRFMDVLVEKGYVICREDRYEPRARDKNTYEITDSGLQYLTACEYPIINWYSKFATPA